MLPNEARMTGLNTYAFIINLLKHTKTYVFKKYESIIETMKLLINFRVYKKKYFKCSLSFKILYTVSISI